MNYKIQNILLLLYSRLNLHLFFLSTICLSVSGYLIFTNPKFCFWNTLNAFHRSWMCFGESVSSISSCVKVMKSISVSTCYNLYFTIVFHFGIYFLTFFFMKTRLIKSLLRSWNEVFPTENILFHPQQGDHSLENFGHFFFLWGMRITLLPFGPLLNLQQVGRK